jgi:2-(1,2-epoxy-1,2-dihydrophenyl)acetyl-CoA isomerase
MSVLDLTTVQCRIADGVGVMTLNDLLEALDGFAADHAVRAIVITGAGRAFSSGADLKDPGARRSDGSVDVLTPLRESYNPVLMRVRTLAKPVVAAVNGPAVGIGCSLALACDLILAAESAYFLLAFVNIGLGLDGGASQTLVTRVGQTRALEMALLGERIAAAKALEWGLVNRVVADDELTPAAGELAARLAAGPPGAYATIKRTVNERAFAGFAELLDLEAVLQQERVESRDFQAAVVAFAQKRTPSFTGE